MTFVRTSIRKRAPARPPASGRIIAVASVLGPVRASLGTLAYVTPTRFATVAGLPEAAVTGDSQSPGPRQGMYEYCEVGS